MGGVRITLRKGVRITFRRGTKRNVGEVVAVCHVIIQAEDRDKLNCRTVGVGCRFRARARV